MEFERTLDLETGPTLAAGGDAVARAPDGRVVFVQGAAPRERVRAAIERDNKSFLRARALSILDPSVDRVTPPCALFGRCGGCTLQHVSREAQSRSKAAQLEDALRRIARLELQRLEIVAPWVGPAYGYRTRARVTVRAQGGRVWLGFHRRRSTELVDVERCPVMVPVLEHAIVALRAAISRVSREEDIDLIAVGDRARARVSERLFEDNPRLASLTEVEVTTGPAAAPDGGDLGGAILLAPGIFAQSNAAGNAALLDFVEEITSAEPAFSRRVIELYSGSGNFTRVLARRAREVIAVEGATDAVALAATTRPQNVELAAEPVERALAGLQQRGAHFDAALLDPPRSGASREVVAGLAALGVDRVILVGCDFANFARETSRFQEVGLALTRVRPFDFYPQTEHAEVAGLLVRQ